MSAATGYIIPNYGCQQLVRSGYVGYDEWMYPRDITENFGYKSLMFQSMLLNHLWKKYGIH